MIPDASGVAPDPSGASLNEVGVAPNPSAVIPDASSGAPDGLGAARKTCGGMPTALSIPLRSLRLAPKERREPSDQLGRDPLLLAGALEEDEGGRGLAVDLLGREDRHQFGREVTPYLFPQGKANRKGS